MLMSATKIVIKYHFKIHSICICKAHLLSCKIHSVVHHVFSLEFVAVIFLVVIIIQLLKWNLMSSPDLYRARKLLQQHQGCFGVLFRGLSACLHWAYAGFSRPPCALQPPVCCCRGQAGSLSKVLMFSPADCPVHNYSGEISMADSWELVCEGYVKWVTFTTSKYSFFEPQVGFVYARCFLKIF